MCLVIDTCCLSHVFNKKNQNHKEYLPVLRWITQGKGCLIYGGEKYSKELISAKSYLRIFAELRRQGRALKLEDAKVDEEAKLAEKRVNQKDFNDEHLVALVVVSGCRVVCTDDNAAKKYLRLASSFPKGVKRPSIYNRHSHHKLCEQRNIVGVCKS